MKEVIFEKTGLPSEVLELKESPMPQPKEGQVLIKVTARNINPSDIMFIRGMYGIAPVLPSSAGFEAAGVVEKGDAGGILKEGTRVMFSAIGTWKEYVCVPASLAIPIPEGMPDEVACQAFVNPMTAYGMLEKSGLKEGDWLLITAGASAFGKFALQMAKEKGIKVAATVRHDDQIEYLEKMGADLVINSEKEKIQKKFSKYITHDFINYPSSIVINENKFKSKIRMKGDSISHLDKDIPSIRVRINDPNSSYESFDLNIPWLRSYHWDLIVRENLSKIIF